VPLSQRGWLEETGVLAAILLFIFDSYMHIYNLTLMSVTNIVFDLEGVILEWVNSKEVMYYDYVIELIEELEVDYDLYYLTNIHTQSGPYCDNTIIKYLLKLGFVGGLASHRTKYKKPHPQFYNQFLDRYNLKAENCLFIDDKFVNTKAASKLGFRIITNQPKITDLRNEISKI
jgi:FMN phosphatase YigB (HAD superfamily)